MNKEDYDSDETTQKTLLFVFLSVPSIWKVEAS